MRYCVIALLRCVIALRKCVDFPLICTFLHLFCPKSNFSCRWSSSLWECCKAYIGKTGIGMRERIAEHDMGIWLSRTIQSSLEFTGAQPRFFQRYAQFSKCPCYFCKWQLRSLDHRDVLRFVSRIFRNVQYMFQKTNNITYTRVLCL